MVEDHTVETLSPELLEIIEVTDAMVEDPENIPDPASPYYLIDSDGFLSVRKTRLGKVATRIKRTPSHLPKLNWNGCFWDDQAPKIQPQVLGMAWNYFAQVFAKQQTEAAVLLCMTDDDQYVLMCPPQEVTRGAVNYEYDPTSIPPEYTLVGTIHSHCDFSAFHSGTDETDAGKHDGLHITMGHVNRDDQPELAISFFFAGIEWKKKLEDICDAQTFEKQEFNEKWLDMTTKVEPKPYVSPAAPVGTYGYMNHQSTWGKHEDNRAAPKSPNKPITLTDEDLFAFPQDQSYSSNQDKAADEMAYDLSVLQAIAANRGLKIRFKITKRGISGPPLHVSNGDENWTTATPSENQLLLPN